MKNGFKLIFGINISALWVLLHSGVSAFCRASRAAFTAAHIQDSRALLSIPEVKLETILDGSEPLIKLAIAKDENGRMPLEQAVALLSILVKESPKEVLEIGTFNGHTASLMALNLENSIIHTVDLPEDFSISSDAGDIPKDDFHLIEKREVGREYKNKPFRDRIIQHFGDTAEWDFSEAGTPTFFFIDGSHTFEYCTRDTEKAFSLSNHKGVFMWHDCDFGHPGVVKSLTYFRKQGFNIVRIYGTPLAYLKLS